MVLGLSLSSWRLLFLSIVTKTLFDFWRLYSPNFPSHLYSSRNSHLRRPFVTAPWNSLIPSTWLVLTTKPTNQKTAKWSTSCQALSIISQVIFHDSSSNELPVNFSIHMFWILHLLYKINWWPIHYVTQRGKPSPTKGGRGYYKTKLHLVVRHQFLRFGESRVLLMAITPL